MCMKNRKTTADIANSIRRTWTINPKTRVVESKKGYKRSQTRKAEKDW
jgi:hypothetical protein